MSLRDLHFLNSYGVYALFGIFILIVLWVMFYSFRKKVLSKLVPSDLQSTLIRPQPAYRYWGRAILASLAWGLAVMAFMEPFEWGDYEVNVSSQMEDRNQEVIFLLDVSSSMAVTDARYGKDRLESAKEIIDDLIAQLSGENASFYYFTSDAFRFVPSTIDYLFLRLMNKNLQLNEGEIGGTDLVATFKTLIEQLKKKPLSVVKTIVLFTDGGDAPYETLEGAEKEKRKDEILQQMTELEKLNTRLLIVGMGSEKGGVVPGVEDQGKPVEAVLQQKLLQEMAAAAQGVYFASNDQPNANLEDKITPRLAYAVPTVAASQEQSKNALIPKFYFQLPLGIAILLLIWVL